MKRRSNAISGWVNFPVNDPAWRNTNEGGMVVKLVVCDDRDDETEFAQCSGAFVTDIQGEVLLADDKRAKPELADGPESMDAVMAHQRAVRAWEQFHFPYLGDSTRGAAEYLSRGYLAVLVLGSTGWSGWHTTRECNWTCGFDDLTDEGKALYRQLEALYPGCTLHLLTFLDT